MVTDESPKYVVTLVHGTFAHDAEWIHAGSQFRKELQGCVNGPIVFAPFQWSGGNSNKARLEAARTLQKHLLGRLRVYPRSEHFVIAHSHGGNVAIYATRKIKHPRLQGVVCLATPFLNCWVRNETLMGLSILLLAVTVMGVFGEFALYMLGLSSAVQFSDSTVRSAAYVIAFVSMGPILLKVYDREQGYVANACKQVELLSTDVHAQVSLIALRLERDEAALWLRFVLFLSALPSLVGNYVERVFDHFVAREESRGINVVMLVMATLMFFAFDYILESDFLIFLFLALILSVPLAMLLFFPIFLLVTVLVWLIRGQIFGLGEAISSSALIGVRYSDGDALVFPPADTSISRLRHSQIYEHSKVVQFVATWMQGLSER